MGPEWEQAFRRPRSVSSQPACVLPEPLGSCGGIAPRPPGHSTAGERQYSQCVSESVLCVWVCVGGGVHESVSVHCPIAHAQMNTNRNTSLCSQRRVYTSRSHTHTHTSSSHAHNINCTHCSLHPPTHSWVPFQWCQQLHLSLCLSLFLSLSLSLSLSVPLFLYLTHTHIHTHTHSHWDTCTHTPVEHLSGCTARSRTPSSHELIGKAIKGSVGPARWRNVLFCYLASKLTKPVRSHLADAGWAIFIYFLLEKLNAGSQCCLTSNSEAILRGRLAGLDMNPPPCVYLGGGWWAPPTSLCMSVTLMVGSWPCSWEVMPFVTPIRLWSPLWDLVLNLHWPNHSQFIEFHACSNWTKADFALKMSMYKPCNLIKRQHEDRKMCGC